MDQIQNEENSLNGLPSLEDEEIDIESHSELSQDIQSDQELSQEYSTDPNTPFEEITFPEDYPETPDPQAGLGGD